MNRILTPAVDTTNLPPERTTAKSPRNWPGAAPYGFQGADFDSLFARLLVFDPSLLFLGSSASHQRRSFGLLVSFASHRQLEKRAPKLVDSQNDFDGLGNVGAAGGGNGYGIGAGRSAVGIRLRSRGAATIAAKGQS
jgi:hypothetical protein